MKLHTVFVTYNRLELTKRAIESYLETVSVPYNLILVDNDSTDGTIEWGLRQDFHMVAMDRNRYPGFATNWGWSHLLNFVDPDATHLHRADNDYGFLPGWCEELEKRFGPKKVGQVGLRTSEQEGHAKSNTGGNCVIRRELWDQGLRWDERPWPEYPPGWTEDSFFSPAVLKMGYRWTRVQKQCIYELQAVYADSNEDPYYEKSWGDRHIHGRTPH